MTLMDTLIYAGTQPLVPEGELMCRAHKIGKNL